MKFTQFVTTALFIISMMVLQNAFAQQQPRKELKGHDWPAYGISQSVPKVPLSPL